MLWGAPGIIDRLRQAANGQLSIRDIAREASGNQLLHFNLRPVLELLYDLIYDVGVNNGDDTAHYLMKGFRVLGVDADPILMAPLQERFAVEIAQGRLTLLNVALA